jgi:uncharacterized membrane protein (UPF0127 family)
MRNRVLFHLAAFVCLHASQASAQEAGQPQPKLPTTPLMIADKKLVAEIADDEAEREIGMMFRKSMADGEGMVFVMASPQRTSFWMKNTLLPLSVAYLNPNGIILEVHDLQPRDETPVSSKFDRIAYAIEVPQGWFLKSGILPGAKVQGLPPLKRQ